jgi:SAM-dependent methyltransferase
MNYPFADRAAEDERLVVQGALFDPLTRRLLQQAGLEPGMRVLDLGSGAGNVARLAAELVGPRGSVVGIERDPAAVTLAQRRTDTANVEFRVGDVQTLEEAGDGFDAVVGRLVLMYLPDPVAALRQAAARARPGRAGLPARSRPELPVGQPAGTAVGSSPRVAPGDAGEGRRLLPHGSLVVHDVPRRRAAGAAPAG